MRTELQRIAAVAIAVAVETAEHADSDVMWGLMDDLPDDCDVHLFVALLRIYQQQLRNHGPESIQRSALTFARSAYGIEP